MFEARLAQGSVLKKLIESIRELVTDANFDVSSSGLALQVPLPPQFVSKPLRPRRSPLRAAWRGSCWAARALGLRSVCPLCTFAGLLGASRHFRIGRLHG